MRGPRVVALGAAGTALVAALAAAPGVLAVQTRSWELTDPVELARGAADGVAIGPRGTLTLAPRLVELALASRGDTGQPILWSLAQDGQTVYAGTGDEGHVLRLAGGEVEILAALPEPHVTALALLPSGRLAAATSPEGAVYSIDGEGNTTVLFESEERYIWSLATGRDGSLYAGTGERGRIYRVDSQGDATLFYDGEDAHVVSLGWDRQGRLLAGTAGHGLLLRIDSSGRATVLLDADQAEISSIAVDGTGTVLASAFPRRQAPAAPPRPVRVQIEPGGPQAPTAAAPLVPGAERPPKGDEEPLLAFVEETSVSARSEETGDGGGSPGSGGSGDRPTLYRIPPTGPAEEAWSSSSGEIFTIAAGADGHVWMGSGTPARLLRLEPGGQVSTIHQFSEGQITALAADPRGRILVATGNGGSLYSLGPARAPSGEFTSAPLDTGTISSWGRLEWEASIPDGARVEVRTRSGASPTPDASWSGWSEPCAAPACPIASPPGRYFQWRARLTGGGRDGADTPILREGGLSSLPRNRAPRLGPVVVPPAGRTPGGIDAPRRPDGNDPADGTRAAATNGTPDPARAALTLESPALAPARRRTVVSAEDPDGDPLSWTASARPAGGGPAVTVSCDGESPVLSCDDAPLAEGRWVLTLRAVDDRANAPGTELSAESESDVFVVDRTPPVLTKEGARGGVRIRASDALSPLAAAEYSPDGTVWRTAAVADGILDSREEEISAAPGLHSGIWFRVRDAEGNESRLQVSEP